MLRCLLRAVLTSLAFALSACTNNLPLARAIEKLGFSLEPNAVRFAVIGDSGTGGRTQREVADRMREYHDVFPFTFVIMLGDNLYGGDSPLDYERKFQIPYKPLLDEKVEFYAALGNHDNPSSESFFAPFHLGGKRYYTFAKGNVHFFALDSNYLDAEQLHWLQEELRVTDTADWKICYMHHPIYSAGSYHGVDPGLRTVLEPLLLEYGVDVVFSGHEHFYERLRPQHGIVYFTSGGAAKLHRRQLGHPEMAAAGYDADQHFMLIEIAGDDLFYRAISRTGRIVDSGVVRRTAHGLDESAAAAAPLPTPRLGDSALQRALN